jgi:hypothetical protein
MTLLNTAPNVVAAVIANAPTQPTHQPAKLATRKASTKKNNRQGYKIPAHEREKGIEAAVQKMKELGLDLEGPKVVITGSNKHSNSVGTDAGQTSTIERYEQFWRPLLDFCIAIGDFESAGILCRKNVLSGGRDLSPADPLPVKLDTAIHFMMMRVLEKGKPLTHHATDLPVLGADGQQILCMGDWHSTNQVQLYSNALSKVHSKYATTNGEYMSECSACQQSSQVDPKANGCRRHVGRPLVWRKGSPTKDALFTTKLKQMKDYCERNHCTRHAMYFLPSELRQIRNHCLAANTKYKLMVWTIWIVGIKGFLRVEEALSLTVEDFREKYFVVSENAVKNLAYFVDGKSDHDPCLLACWDDAECPDFSPVRPILLWLVASGIRSGPLFPPKDQLDSVAVLGTVTGEKTKDGKLPSFSYNDFLKETQFLCSSVLGKDMDSEEMKKLIIGTHMMRKTGYLIAIWGWKRAYGSDECPIDSSNISKSARHSSIHSVAVYASDAATMKTLIECLSLDAADSNQRVGVWKAIHIEHSTKFDSINLASQRYTKPLPELAEWYVAHVLNVPLSSIGTHLMTYHELHRLATAIRPDLSVADELNQLIDANCIAGVATVIKGAILRAQEAKIADAVEKATNELLRNMALHSLRPAAAAAEAPAHPHNPPNKRSRQDNSIEPLKDYQQLAKKKGLSKQDAVALCVEAYDDVKTQVTEGKTFNGTAGFKNWAYRAAKVVDCVHNCHGNCQDSFLAANPNFTISRFKNCAAGIQHTGSYGTE